MRLHFYSLIVSRARHCAMSIRIMGAVWERQDTTPTQKLVLLALADWANDEGHCWPSISRLAEKTGVAGRSVQRLIRQLEDMNLVRREEVSGKGNRYWICIPLTECHPRHSVTPPLTHVHPTPDTVSPNTSYTHQDTSNHMSETPVSDTKETISVEDIVEVWNEIAGKLGKRKVRDITPERRQLIKTRLGQYSEADFIEVFQNIQKSPFLRGETGWMGCGFDWVFKKTNFQKILEGNYNG